MHEIILWTIIFIVALMVLLKASDLFADAVEKVGIYFGIPEFIVGVTIVAFATSLPELITSIISVLKDSSEIVAGNVVGSNVANIFLILGITAIIGKYLKVSHEIINVDLPLLVGSALLFGVFIWDGEVNFTEGFILLIGIVLYLMYAISFGKKKILADRKNNNNATDNQQKEKIKPKTIAIMVLSSGFIYLGATYTIESVIEISRILDIGKEVVAISAIAIGTSLPELVVSFSIIKKGKGEMAIGNILGSNIFNTFAVMGIPAMIGPLQITDSILSIGLPFMIIATVMYLFMTQDKQLTKWEGWLLVIFYIAFIGKIFNLF